jgi:hypothetical protein
MDRFRGCSRRGIRKQERRTTSEIGSEPPIAAELHKKAVSTSDARTMPPLNCYGQGRRFRVKVGFHQKNWRAFKAAEIIVRLCF